MKYYSPYQFALFRFLFGIGLFFYFLLLLPYAPDLTDTNSVGIPIESLGLPSIFSMMYSISAVRIALLTLSLTAALLALGFYRRILILPLLVAFISSTRVIPLLPTPLDGFIVISAAVILLVPHGEACALFPRPRNNWQLPPRWASMIRLIFAFSIFGFGVLSLNRALQVLPASSQPARETYLAIVALIYAIVGALLVPRSTRLYAWVATLATMILFPAPGMLGLYIASFGALVLCLDGTKLFPWQKWVEQEADIFIDGECVLCNGFADFLLREDMHRFFRVASLQGKHARHSLPPRLLEKVSTVILKDSDHFYEKSAAVLRIIGRLGGIWTVAYFFLIIPRPLRDLVYDLVARYRYHWFGKFDVCRLPTAAERGRVLD